MIGSEVILIVESSFCVLSMLTQIKKVLCGVPQGSILGPKLFLTYINDTSHVSNILKFILFADDTNTFCSDKNLKQLSQTVSFELDKLHIIMVYS